MVAAGDPTYQIWMSHTPPGTVIDNLTGQTREINQHIGYSGLLYLDGFDLRGARLPSASACWPTCWPARPSASSTRQVLVKLHRPSGISGREIL
jgi:hypothetical protein